jgi:uncharacterized protein
MKIISIFLLAIASFNCAIAQDKSGNYEGLLDIGVVKLQLILHIEQHGSHAHAKLDIPEQKAKGIPMQNVILTADSLSFSFSQGGFSYKGKWAEAGKINGSFTQGGQSFPLTFEKKNVIEEKKINRPQTPKPPFNYLVEEVVYNDERNSIKYGATLTMPKNTKGPFKAAVLITGSGAQDRDETLFDHKPFGLLANELTQQGIAVLRVDDRGVGLSTGDPKTATTADFVYDVQQHIKYLKARPEIDPTGIGLIGHSEGGLIAPMVASKDKSIAFIISLAGVGEPFDELITRQLNEIDVAYNGVPAEAVKKLRPLTRNMLVNSTNGDAKEVAIDKMLAYNKLWWSKLKPNDTLILKAYSPSVFSKLAETSYKNGADYWKNVTCPVLAINGDSDVQVNAKANLEGIRKALAKNKNVQIEYVPRTNHLLQECNSCASAEYATIEQTMNPKVISLINNWVANAILKK